MGSGPVRELCAPFSLTIARTAGGLSWGVTEILMDRLRGNESLLDQEVRATLFIDTCNSVCNAGLNNAGAFAFNFPRRNMSVSATKCRGGSLCSSSLSSVRSTSLQVGLLQVDVLVMHTPVILFDVLPSYSSLR